MSKHRPLVKPLKLPGEIIGSNHDIVYDILIGYQKVMRSKGWDAYVEKIDVESLNLFGNILSECRSNGFYAPVAKNNQILFQQLVEGDVPPAIPLTLCKICERKKCDRQDHRGKFLKDDNGKEISRCWQDGGDMPF